MEVQNVLDLRAPPAVDALVVVADGKEIAVHGGEHADDLVLHAVGVLKFVDVDIAEPAAAVFERVFILAEQRARLVEQVVEVQRVVAL